METVLKAISDWIKSLLTAAIMSNLSGLFDDVNTQVGNIAQQVGTKPSAFEPRVFAMIEALSRNVVLPIAGIILTFIACYELIVKHSANRCRHRRQIEIIVTATRFSVTYINKLCTQCYRVYHLYHRPQNARSIFYLIYYSLNISYYPYKIKSNRN